MNAHMRFVLIINTVIIISTTILILGLFQMSDSWWSLVGLILLIGKYDYSETNKE